MKKHIINLLILIFGLYLIINSIKDISHLLATGNQLDEAETKLNQLQALHQKLLDQKEYISSNEFVEQQARNKLNMSKSGETIVIIPSDNQNAATKSINQTITPKANWQKWWELFVY